MGLVINTSIDPTVAGLEITGMNLGLTNLVLIKEYNLVLADLVLVEEYNLGIATISSLIYRAIVLVINTSIDLTVAGLKMTKINLSVKYHYLKNCLGQL